MPDETIISRTPVDSSCLRSLGYFGGLGVLELEFAGGEIYRYFDVSSDLYEGLLKSESKGRYFRQFIRELSFIRCKAT